MSFLIFGHRGAPRRARENTVASFEEALRGGADGFETDLRLLADGTPVLFHDHEFADQPVESLTTATLAAERVDALAQFAGRGTMILELKRGGWEAALMDLVTSWPDIVVASFDHVAIAELARRGAKFPLGITVEGVLVDLPEYAKRIGATWIFPEHHRVDAERVRALHAAGMRVVPWTPDRPREWQRLREIGCDGIITNLPAEAVEWRASSRA